MSGVKKLFGKRVKELRKQNHLTQEKLAELIGIDTRNLIKIENGETFPRIQTLEKLLEVLNIAPYEIFRNEHLDNPEILRNKIIQKLENDDELVKLIYKMLF